MIRLQFAYRLILAAVSLLLSFEAPAIPAAEGKASIVQNAARKLVDGRDRPEDRAVLSAAVTGGQFGTRNTPGSGSGGSEVPATFDATPAPIPGLGILAVGAALREYRLRNAHIVLAQFQALFPKHWFW